MEILVKIFNAICILPLVLLFGTELQNEFSFSYELCVSSGAIIWIVIVLLLDIRDSLSRILGKSK